MSRDLVVRYRSVLTVNLRIRDYTNGVSNFGSLPSYSSTSIFSDFSCRRVVKDIGAGGRLRPNGLGLRKLIVFGDRGVVGRLRA